MCGWGLGLAVSSVRFYLRAPVAFWLIARAVWRNRMWLPAVERAPGWQDEEDDFMLYWLGGRECMICFREIKVMLRKYGAYSAIEELRKKWMQ